MYVVLVLCCVDPSSGDVWLWWVSVAAGLLGWRSIDHKDLTCWILTHYLREYCWIGVVSHSTLRHPVARVLL
jgi:hypothetical protein